MRRFLNSAESRQRKGAKAQRFGGAAVTGLGVFVSLRYLLFWAGVVVAVAGSPLWAAAPVRGEIREDTVWQGNVRISADLAIGNAELRLLPGTTVIFDKPVALGEGPVILLNAPIAVYKEAAPGARLTMIGTAEQPITIETAEGKQRGSILCGRGVAAKVTARHVIFRRMGKVVARNIVEPAVQVRMAGENDDAWFSDCQFEDCGPLSVECHSERATLEVRRCSFRQVVGGTAVNVGGLGPGMKVIADNRGDAAVRITCPQMLFRDNILIGPTAAVDVAAPRLIGLRILDNWVSLEAEPLWGRAALSCASTSVTVAGNVLRGGSRVADLSANTIVGNVIVGGRSSAGTQPDAAPPVSPRERPVALLNLTEERSEVTDNYFFGPCHAAISLGRTTRGTVVHRNVFDGLGAATCALAFHELPSIPSGVDLTHNLFLRYKSPPVVNPSKRNGALIEAADNVFVMTPQPAYQGIAGLADLSIRERYLAATELTATELDAAWQQYTDIQNELIAGTITMREARARLCAGYARICEQFNVGVADDERVGPRPKHASATQTQPAAALNQPATAP